MKAKRYCTQCTEEIENLVNGCCPKCKHCLTGEDVFLQIDGNKSQAESVRMKVYPTGHDILGGSHMAVDFSRTLQGIDVGLFIAFSYDENDCDANVIKIDDLISRSAGTPTQDKKIKDKMRNLNYCHIHVINNSKYVLSTCLYGEYLLETDAGVIIKPIGFDIADSLIKKSKSLLKFDEETYGVTSIKF